MHIHITLTLISIISHILIYICIYIYIGNKRESSSYTSILSSIGIDPSMPSDAARVLFVTDVVEEADAATQAGMHTCIARRPGNMEIDEDKLAACMRVVHDFDGI